MKTALAKFALFFPFILLAAFALADGKAYEQASLQAIRENPKLDHSPYTVIVSFNQGVPNAKRAAVMTAANAVFVRDLFPGQDIELWGTNSPEATIGYLRLLPNVKYAEYDYVVHTCNFPNDPLFGDLWGMHNIGQSGGTVDADIDGPEAWDTFIGDPNFVIGDIDTGVDYNHPDLAANIWTNTGEIPGDGIDNDSNGYIDDIRGWDWAYGDNDPMDVHGHGTHTSGTIGAVGNNGIGVCGVNWRCKIACLKFLNDSGSGLTSGAISAVNYCVQMGIKVSSNSWGGGGFSSGLYTAIQAGQSMGFLFVAAAGNNNSNNDASPFYPATYDLNNVISVAATDRFDNRSSFSNYGATTVDVGAPGSSIESTYPGNRYAFASGTSMACPHASGVVALIYGLHPGWTYQQVRQKLFATVRPMAALNGITVTGGMVNAQGAVSGSVNNPPTVVISNPANGSSFSQSFNISFRGTATDPEQGDLTPNIVWTSNLQGQIGTGGSFSRNDLVVGTHTITATVLDAGGLTGSANITITIVANQPPTVTITAPANGSTFVQGAPITFSGTASDPEDGNLTIWILWLSSLDGQIGNGGSFTRSNLSIGTHVITAKILDTGGLISQAQITITVQASSTIPPTPTNFRVVRLSQGVARLTWDDNSNLESGFQIECQMRLGRPWVIYPPINVGANVTTLDDSRGMPGIYRYRIRAMAGALGSPFTDWVMVQL